MVRPDLLAQKAPMGDNAPKLVRRWIFGFLLFCIRPEPYTLEINDVKVN